MKTFLEQVVAGEAQAADIDDFVDRWHDGDTSNPLAESLGMCDDEYALWVERPETLELIIRARAEGMRLERAVAEQPGERQGAGADRPT